MHEDLDKEITGALNAKQMVSEETVESVVDLLTTTDLEEELTRMNMLQPEILAYLTSEDFELLTSDERDVMLYSALVIYKSVKKIKHKFPKVSPQAIESAEEKNWLLLDGVTHKKFRDRISVFFETSPEEDLIAFIEDMLADDDENPITAEGREPIFIALKTIVDVLINA